MYYGGCTFCSKIEKMACTYNFCLRFSVEWSLITKGKEVRKNIYLILIFAVVLTFLSVNEASATSTYGPNMPRKRGHDAGIEGQVLLKRLLRKDYGEVSNVDYFITVSYGVTDWLCIDGKIGIGNVTHKNEIYIPKVDYKYGFAGGYGFRIKLLDHATSGIRVILGGHHISVHPQKETAGNNDKYEACLDDWQGSIIVAKDFKAVTPYVGIKGSDAEIVYEQNDEYATRRYSRYHLGVVAGSDIFLFDRKIKVNVETRFVDETAISTGVSYRF